MKKIIKLFSVCLMFCFSYLSAQVKTSVFKHLDSNEFYYNSLSLGKQGLLLYGWKKNSIFVAKHLDTNLEEKNSWDVKTNNFATFGDIAWQESKGRIVVLFNRKAFEGKIVTLVLGSKDYNSIDIKFPAKTIPTLKLLLVDDKVWFKSKRKGVSFIQKLNIKSGEFSNLDLELGSTKPKAAIVALELISEDEIAVVHKFGPRRKREVDVKVYNPRGDVVVESVLSSLGSEKRSFIRSAKVTKLGNNDYALFGTILKSGKENVRGIDGMYFARYKDSNVKYFSYYDYSDFEYFANYLGENESEKGSEKKGAKDKIKEEKVNHVYYKMRSLPHSAVLIDGGLVFVAEYYHSTYKYVYTMKTVNGKLQYDEDRKFDGYGYTHAIAIGINNDGVKIWDKHIPLVIGYKPLIPIKFLRIMTDSLNTITVLHINGRQILSSVINNGNITNNTWPLPNNIPKVENTQWTMSDNIWWFGKTFFMLGQQKVTEKGKQGDSQIRFYGTGVYVE